VISCLWRGFDKIASFLTLLLYGDEFLVLLDLLWLGLLYISNFWTDWDCKNGWRFRAKRHENEFSDTERSYLKVSFQSTSNVNITQNTRCKLQCRVKESDDVEEASLEGATTTVCEAPAAAAAAVSSRMKLRSLEDRGDQATVRPDTVSLSSFRIATANNICASFCVTCIRFSSDKCLITPSTSSNKSAAFWL